MFYTKAKINDDIEIKVTLYGDDIFTTCPECGKEQQIDDELLSEVLKDGDLASTQIICEDCTDKRKEVAAATTTSNLGEIAKGISDLLLQKHLTQAAAVTATPKVCPKGCDFRAVEPDDNYCGLCGTRLVVFFGNKRKSAWKLPNK